MGFPSNTTRRSLQEHLDRARFVAGAVKSVCQSRQDEMNAGDVVSAKILGLLAQMKAWRAELQAVQSQPGIAAYAVEQIGQDVSADFSAMISALDAAGLWIIQNFPRDGAGYVLDRTMTAQGDLVERVFTRQQTAGLRTALAALIASID